MKKLSLFILLALTAGCSIYRPTSVAEDITKKALSLQDKTMCGGIQDQKGVKYCEGIVNDSLIVNSAGINGDIVLCEKVQDSEYRKACELAATSKKRKLEIDTQQAKRLSDLQNGTSIEACGELQDEASKSQCEINVASKLSFEQGKPELCKVIKDKDLEATCERLAKSAK